MDTTFAHSTCPHDCPSTCALEIERLDDHHIGTVRGARGNDYTSGVICAKVARYAERVHHPDRLRQPLQRVGEKGSGSFRPIDWDDALDIVAEAFRHATETYGSESVWPYFYAGTMGLVQRDGIDRLRHDLRYSGQDETICTALADSGWKAAAGSFIGPDPREMADADLIISWGGNPASTQVNVMSHISRARKERGAKLAVVDPYRTRTAAVADLHLALRPGTDGALACAVMHVLFKEGMADRDYMAEFADCPDDLEKHLASRDPVWAAAITGLTEDEITAFARMIGQTPRTYIRLGYGFSRSRNGAANMHAATSIATVAGLWRHKGGGAMYSNRDLYHIDPTLIEGLDVMDPTVRMLDMSRIGPVLTNDPRDIGDGPPVTAMIMQNTNPAVVAPESRKVREGLLRDDLFLCVHEQFMTDTAALADIVLPATTFLEHDDIYKGGGHMYLQVGPKVIEPFAEARSNHDVIAALAKRLGATHRGFDMEAWEIVDETLRVSGHPGWEEMKEKHWLDCMVDFDTAHHLNGFGTDDGKFHFRPDWSSIGRDHEQMPVLPDHMAVTEEHDEKHPFRLLTSPAHNFLNTSFTEVKTGIDKEARPSVLLTDADAAALGLSDGAQARVGNGRGDILVHARTGGSQQRGVVVIEGIWPNRAFIEGIGVNTLISADRGMPNGGAVFHDTAVWVRAA